MNNNVVLTIAGFALALFGLRSEAIEAQAAAATDASLPPVTVIAPSPPDAKELSNDSVGNFIASHARPAVVTGQLSRWRDGICPVTTGLSPGFNAFISARISAVAASVGAPHKEGEPCKANAHIFFTTEPDKLIQDIQKRGAALLGFHYPHQLQKVASISHPIQGWYVTATQGDNGVIAIDDATPMQLGTPGALMQAGAVPSGRLGSHLTTGRGSLIVNVIVVADTTKVAGYTAGAISDYLAMLVLSQTRSPEACGQLPSILDLMVPHCATDKRPDAVTAGDLAFLRALYMTDLREGMSIAESEIQNKMIRELTSPHQ